MITDHHLDRFNVVLELFAYRYASLSSLKILVPHSRIIVRYVFLVRTGSQKTSFWSHPKTNPSRLTSLHGKWTYGLNSGRI